MWANIILKIILKFILKKRFSCNSAYIDFFFWFILYFRHYLKENIILIFYYNIHIIYLFYLIYVASFLGHSKNILSYYNWEKFNLKIRYNFFLYMFKLNVINKNKNIFLKY